MRRIHSAPAVHKALIALALAGAVIWLQLQHLADTPHEHALLALVCVGYLAFWMAQGKHS